MDDLVEFLRARLDEDERIAREAAPGPWEQDPERFDFLVSAEHGYVVDCSGARAAAENAAHVAAHDPARVLRDSEAKRELLSRYEAMEVDVLVMTGADAILAEYQRVILPNLALPYVDHPGYREEWRP
ncbi:DUF6221 family protein [Streptomyces misionensis]|uniref:DUF6221 family protein n=1 Tax=Streptomyces misionensis TaxID=67331 RepID=UPI0036C95243